jgi:hypothetical protein
VAGFCGVPRAPFLLLYLPRLPGPDHLRVPRLIHSDTPKSSYLLRLGEHASERSAAKMAAVRNRICAARPILYRRLLAGVRHPDSRRRGRGICLLPSARARPPFHPRPLISELVSSHQAMYFLKEAAGTITYPMDRAAAYATLLSRLKKLCLPVEKADESTGEVVVRCFALVLDLGLWRCWADRLVFEVAQVHPNSSAIHLRDPEFDEDQDEAR